MSIIGKVGRKSLKYRALDTSIHLVLILGAITMVYPFLLMLSSSIKSGVDSHDMSIIPAYLYSDAALYQKYIESRYNEESSRLMDNYPGSWISFREVEPPSRTVDNLGADWVEFVANSSDKYGVYHYYLAEHYGRGVYPLVQRMYRKIIREETGNDLVEFNRIYNTGARFWEEIMVEEKDISRRNFVSSSEGYLGRFRSFKVQSPLWMRFYINHEGSFINSELIPAFSADLERLNSTFGTSYRNWDELRLSEHCPPPDDPLRPYWLHYVREVVNIHHLKIDPVATSAFQQALKQKYDNIGMLNQTWNSGYKSFDSIVIPDPMPDSGASTEDIAFFIQNVALPEQIQIVSIASDLRSFLQDKYSSIEILNQQWDTAYESFDGISYPADQIDYYHFRQRKPEIRKEFFIRNYAMALEQMLSDARSLRNTGIYVFLSILVAVLVNPLAAYALSRFKPAYTYQIIMLFMLTMAFPAMVMGIPNFLMLKRLNMLNTFWALILPAAADGYFIFLLKGFFDSLPRELYDSASLDGAGEFRLFWQFTLFLSKPILAVIALGAFNAAYRNFLFAFLVCQDQSMWTLMVHIYELMQRASASVGYAALVITAIPTLLVFIFFQNVIIKGIVIPMEK